MEKSLAHNEKRLLNTLKKRAESAFLRGNYEESLKQYSNAMVLHQSDTESHVGLLLADLAADYETESKALYDYYQILKRENRAGADKILLNLVESFDGNLSKMAAMTQIINALNIDRNDGILYSDFKKHLEQSNNFKEACEDMIFSTRIILTSREEFIEFLEILVEHGFAQMALVYLDEVYDKMSLDSKIGEIYSKILNAQ